jgi:hypothetical protein
LVKGFEYPFSLENGYISNGGGLKGNVLDDFKGYYFRGMDFTFEKQDESSLNYGRMKKGMIESFNEQSPAKITWDAEDENFIHGEYEFQKQKGRIEIIIIPDLQGKKARIIYKITESADPAMLPK